MLFNKNLTNPLRSNVIKWLWSLLKITLAVVLITVSLEQFHVKKIADSDMRFTVIAGLVLLMQNVLVALRWWFLLRALNISLHLSFVRR